MRLQLDCGLLGRRTAPAGSSGEAERGTPSRRRDFQPPGPPAVRQSPSVPDEHAAGQQMVAHCRCKPGLDSRGRCSDAVLSIESDDERRCCCEAPL
ncbi:hypothetical protein FA09DRAFT_331368 [Tilletiopsis washingtonensis]|uniref:Uncharacterized protein n=1 Tax=Tilletiopsis washingtonensis TaxID=58919 RepID=A0A316Z4J1_9BASI|nr:hypothetical protein FA09DRAFT_331368 [Tilletiopsis washingtonensis]PWN96509.1 hypothetical protein FA09DRAFT_331368 [Tilletiopsis washingtonensis]